MSYRIRPSAQAEVSDTHFLSGVLGFLSESSGGFLVSGTHFLSGILGFLSC
jgi:hypothetical protein